MNNKIQRFGCTQPCNNCPYRTDAPLKLWHKTEYIKLLDFEKDPIGTIYGCHKDNGSICVGWLIKQYENNFPSIALRLSLSRNNITREYLNSLHSPSPLYKNLETMIKKKFSFTFKKKIR
jgi:hypothetical protein